MIAGYFAVALAGTWINYVDVHLNSVGVYDLSINQQALSSTIHSGQPYPFYESTNCGRNARCSFLLVHPSFLAYVVAVPYALAPSAFTLFAIQDAVLGLAALPLYGVARRAGLSKRLSLATVAVYLVWLPAFSGIFSFHWEAFLPLEVFTVIYCWLTHRYIEAIPVILIGFITLEIVPALFFFVGVYFLYPWIAQAGRYVLAWLNYNTVPPAAGAPRPPNIVRRAWNALKRVDGGVQSLALLVGSVAAYVFLHEFVAHGGGLLGLPPLPSTYQLPLSQPVHSENFTLGNLLKGGSQKIVFWVVIYATVAMIPLLAPRTLILSVPWIIFSLFATAGYYHMGNQYAFITASVMFVGFVYGLVRIQRWMSRSDAPAPSASSSGPSGAVRTGVASSTPAVYDEGRASVPAGAAAWGEEPTPPVNSGQASASRPRGGTPPRWALDGRQRRASFAVGGLLVAIIAVNAFLNPFNPFSAAFKSDAPFASQAALALGQGYSPASYNQIEQMVSIIGAGGIAAVSPLLFSFVANDRYAYPMSPGMNLSNLPFDALNGTDFVMLLDHGGNSIPTNLQKEIYNTSYFGVRAWIANTYVGGILLFQRGYTGPAQLLGSYTNFTTGTYTASAGLLPGSAGVYAGDPTSVSGTVLTTGVSTKPDHHLVGRVFGGPSIALGAGTYQVTASLRGTGVPPSTNASTKSLVLLRLAGYKDSIGHFKVYYSSFEYNSSWINVTFDVTLPYPVLSFQILGTNQQSWFDFTVNYVMLTAVPPPS